MQRWPFGCRFRIAHWLGSSFAFLNDVPTSTFSNSQPQLPKSHCTIFSVFSQTQMNSSARTVLTKTHSNDHPSVPPGRWIAASPVLTQTHWNDHPSIAPGRWAAALPVQSCSFTFSFQFAFWSIFITCNWSERLTVSIKRQTCTSFNHDKTTACLAPFTILNVWQTLTSKF